MHVHYSPRCRGTCAWWTLWQVFDLPKKNMIFQKKNVILYISSFCFLCLIFLSEIRHQKQIYITALHPIQKKNQLCFFSIFFILLIIIDVNSVEKFYNKVTLFTSLLVPFWWQRVLPFWQQLLSSIEPFALLMHGQR